MPKDGLSLLPLKSHEKPVILIVRLLSRVQEFQTTKTVDGKFLVFSKESSF